MHVVDALGGLTDRREFDVWGFLLFSHGWTWAWWSILAVVAFHFVQNATGQYLSLSPAAARAQTVVTVVATIVILAYWGPRELRR